MFRQAKLTFYNPDDESGIDNIQIYRSVGLGAMIKQRETIPFVTGQEPYIWKDYGIPRYAGTELTYEVRFYTKDGDYELASDTLTPSGTLTAMTPFSTEQQTSVRLAPIFGAKSLRVKLSFNPFDVDPATDHFMFGQRKTGSLWYVGIVGNKYVVGAGSTVYEATGYQPDATLLNDLELIDAGDNVILIMNDVEVLNVPHDWDRNLSSFMVGATDEVEESSFSIGTHFNGYISDIEVSNDGEIVYSHELKGYFAGAAALNGTTYQLGELIPQTGSWTHDASWTDLGGGVYRKDGNNGTLASIGFPSDSPEIERKRMYLVEARVTGLTGTDPYQVFTDPPEHIQKLSAVNGEVSCIAMSGADGGLWFDFPTPTNHTIENIRIRKVTGTAAPSNLPAPALFLVEGENEDGFVDIKSELEASLVGMEAAVGEVTMGPGGEWTATTLGGATMRYWFAEGSLKDGAYFVFFESNATEDLSSKFGEGLSMDFPPDQGIMAFYRFGTDSHVGDEANYLDVSIPAGTKFRLHLMHYVTAGIASLAAQNLTVEEVIL